MQAPRSLWFVSVLVVGCADPRAMPVDGPTDPSPWFEGDRKVDRLRGRLGPRASANADEHEVWRAENRWSDRDTAAARRAGLAWPENSGLSWEEKYRRWVASLERIPCEDCYGDTFAIVTPTGKWLPSPSLECAEVALFLRVAFASWHGLPLFMEARWHGEPIFYGHFGVRGIDGALPGSTKFARFADFSSTHIVGERWPRDAALRRRRLSRRSADDQPQIDADAHAGAYLDEAFLNKRVGFFLLELLVAMGSINLADPVNTYNIAPESVSAGDVLVHRYGLGGIGHTFVVIAASWSNTPDRRLAVGLASGSMPRRQPRVETSSGVRRALSARAGGGIDMAGFGGGIKRWRQARAVAGRWRNVVADGDELAWVDSEDREALEARPQRFRELLGGESLIDRFVAALESIDASRDWLRRHPASCAARTRREDSFDELYQLAAQLGLSREAVDERYRDDDDYLLAELDYDQSRTCCWTESVGAMMTVIRADAAASGARCPVFMARDDDGDGYERYRSMADALGLGWPQWRAGERCPQDDVIEDAPTGRPRRSGCGAPPSGNSLNPQISH